MKGKQIWTQQEDQCLKSLVFGQKQNYDWTSVAQKLNYFFSNKSRTAKQCRERYINYTSFTEGQYSGNSWTTQQNKALFGLFQIWGSRWTKISQQIKGKSQNCVKNRFYGSLRKALRKMNRASKNLIKKFKKQVKYQSITRIIEASEGLFRLQSPLKEESQELTKKILDLAQKEQEQMLASEAQSLIIEINRFNMATRSYKSKKKIKNQKCNLKKYDLDMSLGKKDTSCSISYKNNDIEDDNAQNFEQNGSSTNQENQKIGQILPMKNQMKEEFLQSFQQLRDFSEWQGIQLNCRYSLQNLDHLFLQAQSPLQCEAWI